MSARKTKKPKAKPKRVTARCPDCGEQLSVPHRRACSRRAA